MKFGALALVVGVVVGGVGGHLFAKKSSTFERRKECGEVGVRFLQQKVVEEAPAQVFNVRYSYYPELDTCLCSYVAAVTEDTASAKVYDSLKNELVLSRTGEPGTPEYEKFLDQYEEMMQVEVAR